MGRQRAKWSTEMNGDIDLDYRPATDFAPKKLEEMLP